eukprot:10452-Heterococcus_DN1.PRE.1
MTCTHTYPVLIYVGNGGGYSVMGMVVILMDGDKTMASAGVCINNVARKQLVLVNTCSTPKEPASSMSTFVSCLSACSLCVNSSNQI